LDKPQPTAQNSVKPLNNDDLFQRLVGLCRTRYHELVDDKKVNSARAIEIIIVDMRRKRIEGMPERDVNNILKMMTFILKIYEIEIRHNAVSDELHKARNEYQVFLFQHQN